MVDGIALLDVGIGLAFMFLVMSVFASSLHELVAGFTRIRAGVLKQAILVLLSDKRPDVFKSLINLKGTSHVDSPIGNAVIEHAIFRNLGQPLGDVRKSVVTRLGGDEGPAYLSSTQFTEILMDVLTRLAKDRSLPALVADLPAGSLKDILQTFVSSSANLDELKQKLARWYDEFMERVSGWYKRRTQLFLFFIGLGLAFQFQIDTIAYSKRLLTDGALRGMMVERALEYTSGPQAAENVGAADLDIPALLTEFRSGTPADYESGNLALATSKSLCDAILPMCAAGDTACLNDRERRAALYTDWGGELGGELCAAIRSMTAIPAPAAEPTHPVSEEGWRYVLGLVLTAFAISLGAPYWLSLLRILNSIRSSKGESSAAAAEAVAPAVAGTVSAPVTAGTGDFEATLNMRDIEDVQLLLGLRGQRLTGQFDLQTRELLSRWQRNHGIPATGKLTLRTYELLKKI